MSDPNSAPAVVPETTKPTGTLTLQQAVAAQLAKMQSAPAPTARPDPVAAETAETTNQGDAARESEQAEGVEQEGETAAEAAGEQSRNRRPTSRRRRARKSRSLTTARSFWPTASAGPARNSPKA